jgi:hypothetical protein
LLASAGLGAGCFAIVYQNFVKQTKILFFSIHKPPAAFKFASVKQALAVLVEPFKFSPA